MTTDELRAAAAEVVAVVGGYIASGDELAHEVQAKAVAEAYLAEHPADDGEAVTPDVVRQLLPSDRDGKRGMHFGPFGEVEWYASSGEFHVWVSGRRLKLDGVTRGQFRRLCVGLGVPLTEAE